MLGLLDRVERDGNCSQRDLASELGIALGLVNAYVKRCVRKGLLKARQAPARRYTYYLTPRGFGEKSRLTVEYLSYSFGFFREAKADCIEVFRLAEARGFDRVVLAGRSDLAEIAAICALERNISIAAIVDTRPPEGNSIGLPLVSGFDHVRDGFSAVVVTDLISPSETCADAVRRFGADRVLVPNLLRVRLGTGGRAS